MTSEEGRLTKDAKKAIAEARAAPDYEFISNETLKKRIFR